MTYEERKKWLCEQCNQKTDCAYVNRKMEYKCILVEERLEGWEFGYKDAVEKALKWWKEELTYPSMSAEEIAWINTKIEDFKKYVEEQ